VGGTFLTHMRVGFPSGDRTPGPRFSGSAPKRSARRDARAQPKKQRSGPARENGHFARDGTRIDRAEAPTGLPEGMGQARCRRVVRARQRRVVISNSTEWGGAANRIARLRCRSFAQRHHCLAEARIRGRRMVRGGPKGPAPQASGERPAGPDHMAPSTPVGQRQWSRGWDPPWLCESESVSRWNSGKRWKRRSIHPCRKSLGTCSFFYFFRRQERLFERMTGAGRAAAIRHAEGICANRGCTIQRSSRGGTSSGKRSRTAESQPRFRLCGGGGVFVSGCAVAGAAGGTP